MAHYLAIRSGRTVIKVMRQTKRNNSPAHNSCNFKLVQMQDVQKFTSINRIKALANPRRGAEMKLKRKRTTTTTEAAMCCLFTPCVPPAAALSIALALVPKCGGAITCAHGRETRTFTVLNNLDCQPPSTHRTHPCSRLLLFFFPCLQLGLM